MRITTRHRSGDNSDEEKETYTNLDLNEKPQQTQTMTTTRRQGSPTHRKTATDRRYRPDQAACPQQPSRRPPWLAVPKPKKQSSLKNQNKQPSSSPPSKNPVTGLIRLRQEETWNDFLHHSLNPLWTKHGVVGVGVAPVFRGLFYMGIHCHVLECAAHLILDDDCLDAALSDLAQFLAYGVTRVPTPAGISQRLALLHVICTFREHFHRQQVQNEQSPTITTEGADPVVLWYFLMGQGVGGIEENVIYLAWQSGEDPFYVWCWELRALVLRLLANEEQERRLAQATADQMSHAVSMAAITVELSLNESAEFVCYGMGKGCEWIKSRLGTPVIINAIPEDILFTDNPFDFDFEIPNIRDEEFDRSSQVSLSTLSSVSSTSTACGAPSTISFSAYSRATTKSSSTKKTKHVIVEETYMSYSRTARKTTENACQATLFYIGHWKNISTQGLCQAAESSRNWATTNVDANMQHWAYVDAASKVGLASLGAMGILGEAVFRNTHLLVDQTTTVTTDLIQHQFGPTAASLFADVSWTALNVWRMTLYLASLGTPAVFAKAVVKHASREQLRQQQEQEQMIRQQFGTQTTATTTNETNAVSSYLEYGCDFTED